MANPSQLPVVETLWDLATEWAPQMGVSMGALLEAFKKANPTINENDMIPLGTTVMFPTTAEAGGKTQMQVFPPSTGTGLTIEITKGSQDYLSLIVLGTVLISYLLYNEE